MKKFDGTILKKSIVIHLELLHFVGLCLKFPIGMECLTNLKIEDIKPLLNLG